VSAVALVLLAATVLTGYLIHRDYGVSWDEPIQQHYGRNIAEDAVHGGGSAADDPLKAYGPAYEMALVAVQFVSGVRDAAEIFPLRHLLNFLTFAIGLIFFYKLGALFLRNRAASLAACAALVLSPVIFGHAFFNSKDMPFLTFFVVAMYSLVRFLDRPRWTTALRHALASGWLVAVREPGLQLVVLGVAAAVWIAFRLPGPLRTRRLVWLGPYLVVTSACIVLFWPSLWSHPWTNFWFAVRTMSRYPWPGAVIYAGAEIPATALPWHYVFTWIAITTPLAYLAGFAAGLPPVIRAAWRELRGSSSVDGLHACLLLAWFFVPIASVIAFRSVLYDGWRHLYFVYPALLLIAAKGYLVTGHVLRERWSRHWSIRAAGAGAGLLVIVNVAAVTVFMIRAHPYEHVYFNELVGGLRGARFQFDMDYWGLSYRRGLEAILRSDQDAVIPVYAMDGPGEENASALPFQQRHRLLFVESLDQAKYFVGAYRYRRAEYPYRDVIDRVEVNGVPILLVAAINRQIALTPDTVPAVAAVRARNGAALAGLDDETVRRRAGDAVRTWLGRFVRHPRVLDVDLSGDEPVDLRQGRFARLHVRILDAEIGDFKRDKPGIPLRALEMTVDDLIIDVADPLASIRPAMMRQLTIGEFTLEEGPANDALARMSGTLGRVRLHFQNDAIRIEYLGQPAAEVTARVWIGPDPWKARGDNFWVTSDRLRVSGWRVPAAWLLNMLLRQYAPVIAPDQIDATVFLGGIQTRNGVFRLGTIVNGTSR